jgi:CheY-like chemotaxis protein
MNQVKELLLVEDNDSDAELITLALKSLDGLLKIDRAKDGIEAIDLLNTKQNTGDVFSLVLLDVKLPRMNGIEVLSRIKDNAALKCIPVVMLTSSREQRDIIDCYNNGANAYVVKPLDFNELTSVLNCIGEFWCVINEIPD